MRARLGPLPNRNFRMSCEPVAAERQRSVLSSVMFARAHVLDRNKSNPKTRRRCIV